jgi:hypothetical protein
LVLAAEEWGWIQSDASETVLGPLLYLYQ